MSDFVVRAEDNDAPLLDGEGKPISELELDRVDAAVEQGASVAELASDQRSWRFGHVIVDEAQDLTPMQWRMIARRTRGDSMTVVGDLAQRSIGEPGEWSDHLPPSIRNVSYQELTINYRAPAEVNDLARAVLAQLAPKLTAPRSIRSVGRSPKAVEVRSIALELPLLIDAAMDRLGTGSIVVICLDAEQDNEMNRALRARDVTVLTPRQAKGLEFDAVFLVEPSDILAEPWGLSLLYVSITRSTQELSILYKNELPSVLADAIAESDQTRL